MPNFLKFNTIPKNTVHKSLIVRDMNNNDLDDVFAIETAAHPFPWTKKMFLDSLTGDYINWVLVQGGRPPIFAKATLGKHKSPLQGFVIFSIKAGECNILNLCIKPEEQHQGYGYKLLETVLKYAKRNGAYLAFLEVRKSNIAAIKLYYKMGFKKSGVRKNYYCSSSRGLTAGSRFPAFAGNDGKEDALVLQLNLSET